MVQKRWQSAWSHQMPHGIAVERAPRGQEAWCLVLVCTFPFRASASSFVNWGHVYSFYTYLLRTHYMLGITLSTGNTIMSKTNIRLAPMTLTVQQHRQDISQIVASGYNYRMWWMLGNSNNPKVETTQIPREGQSGWSGRGRMVLDEVREVGKGPR